MGHDFFEVPSAEVAALYVLHKFLNENPLATYSQVLTFVEKRVPGALEISIVESLFMARFSERLPVQ